MEETTAKNRITKPTKENPISLKKCHCGHSAIPLSIFNRGDKKYCVACYSKFLSKEDSKRDFFNSISERKLKSRIKNGAC